MYIFVVGQNDFNFNVWTLECYSTKANFNMKLRHLTKYSILFSIMYWLIYLFIYLLIKHNICTEVHQI